MRLVLSGIVSVNDWHRVYERREAGAIYIGDVNVIDAIYQRGFSSHVTATLNHQILAVGDCVAQDNMLTVGDCDLLRFLHALHTQPATLVIDNRMSQQKREFLVHLQYLLNSLEVVAGECQSRFLGPVGSAAELAVDSLAHTIDLVRDAIERPTALD